MKKLLATVACLIFLSYGRAQVIISLIFGDKLNSGKVEFGLDGGLSLADIQGINPSKLKNGFNLGFYFDIKLKNSNWMLSTGVIVKSPAGARGLPVYALGDPVLDSIFTGGSISTNLSYFHVPVTFKYTFRSKIYVKAGTQLGLLNKASDVFNQTVENSDDLQYTVKNRSNYHPIDAGLVFGVGYRLMGGNGMNLGIQYYLGMIDVLIDDKQPGRYNRIFYATVGIPIGKAASQKKKAK